MPVSGKCELSGLARLIIATATLLDVSLARSWIEYFHGRILIDFGANC
jgi:hypothetical protein